MPLRTVTLQGGPAANVFVFLHGLASSEGDLYPLACEFHARGQTCEIVRLPSHPDVIEQIDHIDTDELVRDVTEIINRHRSGVYLVGFSAGATLALIAAKNPLVKGVFAFSAFLTPRRRSLSAIGARLGRRIPKWSFPRHPHTTVPATRGQLYATTRLPLFALRHALELGRRATASLSQLRCPVLFFHSLDDKVSRYEAVARAMTQCPTGSRLVTFNRLDHFLQFDVPVSRVYEFAACFFAFSQTAAAAPLPIGYADLIKIYSDERRHWTLVLFQVIAGALTALALLLYNTIGDIVSAKPNAPYYLMVYSLISSFYTILAVMYFFYANRVDAYIKMFVEPLAPSVPWVTFRTSQYISGSESPKITRLTALPLMIIPILFGIGSLVACYLQFGAEAIAHWPNRIPMIVGFCSAAVMCLYSVGFAVFHSGAARRWLILIPAPEATSPEAERLLSNLYRSILPGSVRQPVGYTGLFPKPRPAVARG